MVEHPGSDTACLIYAIYEIRYFDTSSLALFRNKEHPELLFNKSVGYLPDRDPCYSKDGTYLFLQTMFPDHTIVYLVLDMVRERSSSFSTGSVYGYAYEVQEEAPNRFTLQVGQLWMRISGPEIQTLPLLSIEIAQLEWRPFSELDTFPGLPSK